MMFIESEMFLLYNLQIKDMANTFIEHSMVINNFVINVGSQIKSTNFLGVPRFIMEVLSDANEQYDRNEKMELYKRVEVAEYWLVDWRKKQIEIYLLIPDEQSVDENAYKRVPVITGQNKNDLKIHVFPDIQIGFEQLFDGID